MPWDTDNIRDDRRASKMNREDPERVVLCDRSADHQKGTPFAQAANNGCTYAEGEDQYGTIAEGHRAPAPISMSHAGMFYPRRADPFGNRSGE